MTAVLNCDKASAAVIHAVVLLDLAARRTGYRSITITNQGQLRKTADATW